MKVRTKGLRHLRVGELGGYKAGVYNKSNHETPLLRTRSVGLRRVGGYEGCLMLRIDLQRSPLLAGRVQQQQNERTRVPEREAPTTAPTTKENVIKNSQTSTAGESDAAAGGRRKEEEVPRGDEGGDAGLRLSPRGVLVRIDYRVCTSQIMKSPSDAWRAGE